MTVTEQERKMINNKIQEALNKQINAELYSSYLYLSMSSYFQSINLNGFANWMRCQAQEELVHAMKFYNFINDRGGIVKLAPIEGPPIKWNSPLHAFQEAYAHEEKVTGLINDLVELTMKQKDHASVTFLQWFVNEQVEEEASADGVVQQLKLAGDVGSGLFMIDRELASRTFVMPTVL
jgi:ferritin